MKNPLASVVNNFFPQAQSKELIEAKVEIEKFILHHPVALYYGKEEGADTDESAVAILKQFFDSKWIGFHLLEDSEVMHHALTIRIYDRNTNMGPLIHLPQIFVEGRHIGDLKELKKRVKDPDWPEIVARVNEGPSKDEPLYWMSQANAEPSIPAVAPTATA